MIGSTRVTALCSEGPMFRRSYVQKVLWSEGPLFRRFYVQKVLYSEGSMFRRSYVQKYLFRRSYVQKVGVTTAHDVFDVVCSVGFSELK